MKKIPAYFYRLGFFLKKYIKIEENQKFLHIYIQKQFERGLRLLT